MNDIRNNEIKAGAAVVYNRSGYLEHGVVEKLIVNTYSRRGWVHRNFINYRVRNTRDGKLSKVRDRRSLMVIYET